MSERTSGSRPVVGAGTQRPPVDRDLAQADDPIEARARAVQLALELDLDRVAAQLALEGVGRSARDDAPAVDDRQVGREPVGLLEVVGGEQDRDALIAAQPLDLLPHVGPDLGVEPGRGLVEEQDTRPVHEREPDVESPLHAAREGADDAVGRLAEAEAAEQLVDAPFELRAAHALQPAAQTQVLARRRLAVGASALGHHADAAPHLGGVRADVVAGDRRAALVGARQRREDADRRGLAGAVRPEKAEDRALLHRERQAVEGPHIARILLDEAHCLYCAACHCRPPGVCFSKSEILDHRIFRMSNDIPQIVTEWAQGLSEERVALLQELIATNRAYQTAVEKMDEAFSKLAGVNRTDGRCLDVIDQQPGLTAGELATAVGLSPGAVTTALDRLEARGFVTRARDPNDRRRVTLAPTPEFNRLAWAAYGPLAEMGGPFIAELSDEELGAIIRFLRGGTVINEQRSGQLLAEAAAASSAANDSNEERDPAESEKRPA